MRLEAEFGPVLTGRGSATGFRELVEHLLETTDGDLVLDFAGVVAVSPSFADEVFAKLPDEAVDRIIFQNLSPDLAAAARFVRRTRGLDAELG